MLYNKNNVRKTNDKKILHKVGKQWKVVSVALLMAVAGGAVAATSTQANADNNVDVTNATSVKTEASELTDNNFTAPASATPSSSANSKSTAAPSLASYSYAASSRVNGHNADAASYANNYEFDQAEMSYYGPMVKGYVSSMNKRFPEARALQSSYNSESTNASADSSAAKSYSAKAANPANQSLISAMASKAGVPTTSAFVDSVEYQTQSFASAVSDGSNENSAMSFVNSIVNQIVNGNPSNSAFEAATSYTTASALYSSAVALSNAYSQEESAINSASSDNQSMLDAANNAVQVISGKIQVASAFSGMDSTTVDLAAHSASDISMGSYANSDAVSSAVSSAASWANSYLASSFATASKKGNKVNQSTATSEFFQYSGESTDAVNNTNFTNPNLVNFQVGKYSLAEQTDANKAAMLRDISDTAVISAKASVESSAAKVIATAKNYQSQHANDLSSASAQAASDKANVQSASNAWAMAAANSAIASVVADNAKTSSDAVYFVNSMLGNPDGIASYFANSVSAQNGNYFTASLNSEVNSVGSAAVSYASSLDASVNTQENSAFATEDLNFFLQDVSSAIGMTTTSENNPFSGASHTIDSSANAQSVFAAASDNAAFTNTDDMNDDYYDGVGFASSTGYTDSASTEANLAMNLFNSYASDVGFNNLAVSLDSGDNANTKAFFAMSNIVAKATSAESTAVSSADSLADKADSVADSMDPTYDETYADPALSASIFTSNFNSAVNASASAAGVDLSVITNGKKNFAFSNYASAVTNYETSVSSSASVAGSAENVGTLSNLNSANSLAQSSANSSYNATVSASAKYSADNNVDTVLASYFASSDASQASSEAVLASSASSALTSYYDANGGSAFSSANTKFTSASNEVSGNKTMANAEGTFVAEHSPKFITLTKNAELHNAVLFNKKTAVKAVKAGTQFHVLGVAFDKVGTIRYIVGANKNGQHEYVTANDAYVKNTYLEPDAYYTVKLNKDAAGHATKDFSSKVVKTFKAGTQLTGQAVPTVANNGKWDYYFGVSRLAVQLGDKDKTTVYLTTNDKYVSVVPNQTNNNNNGSSASANNMKPASNAPLVLFH